MELAGTASLVTGASSGIGAATAAALAATDSHPLLVGRDAARLDSVAARTGGTPIRADLTTTEGRESTVSQAVRAAGTIDVLINNAGIGWAGPSTAMHPTDVTRLVDINLTAPLLLTQLVAEHMRERGRGHVVHISSIAGSTAVPDEAVYSATKAGLDVFADATRGELGESGIGVSVVVPGVVDTPFFSNRGRPYDRRWPRPVPPGRLAEAILDAVRRERAEVFVPRWMRIPARLRGGFPGLYRALATRFG